MNRCTSLVALMLMLTCLARPAAAADHWSTADASSVATALPPDQLRALGFGRGLGPLPFTPEGTLSTGAPGNQAGSSRVIVHGAAYAPALPGVGVPAPGHLWVLVDVQVTNLSAASLPLPDGLRFSLADSLQVLYNYPADVRASDAVGSPFTAGLDALGARRTLRGFVVFAVPVGTPNLWYMVESRAGQSPDKAKVYSSAHRGPIGDLTGSERIFPRGTGPRAGIAQLQGVYGPVADAVAVVAAARKRGIPGWVEAGPDGRYAAIVGLRYFAK